MFKALGVQVALMICLMAKMNDAQRVAQKKVNAVCMYNAEESSITMYFYADYNGDTVDKVLAINGRVYNRANNNEAACLHTTRGSPEKILITSKLYTDDSQNPNNLCGGRRTNPNSANAFEWTIELRENFAEEVYRELDRRYLILCTVANAQDNYITTAIQVFGEDKEEDALRVRPINEMSVLEQQGSSFVALDAGVSINQYVKFRIQSTLHPSYEDFLHYYGISAFRCILSKSASFSDEVVFISQDGCPASTDPFGLTTGLSKVAANVAPNGFFRLETEAFIFAPTIPETTRYFVACYLEYCFGDYDPINPDNNDQKCENRCNSKKRRRKRSLSLSDYDRVVVTVDIDTSSVDKSQKPEKLTQTTMIAVAATVGVLILGLIIVIAVLLLVARRRRYKADDTSSQGSTNDLPVHTVIKT